MIINKALRDQIRQRAAFACEYCGVSESDTGGLLTLDHFQPQSKGGSDQPENLIYCCNRCNSYKHNYFPSSNKEPSLWNPTQSDKDLHFFELDNGQLKALTPIGKVTIDLLRLNRDSLIQYRLQKNARAEEIQLLKQYQQLIDLLQQTNQELTVVVSNQQDLLEQQQKLLRLLLDEEGLL